MDLKTIQKAILSNSPQKVVSVFKSVDASGRKLVAKDVATWVDRLHRDCTAGARTRGALRADLRELEFDLDKLDESYRYGFSPVARLALFATQPMSKLAEHTWSFDDGEKCVNATFEILRDRQVDWCDDLVGKLLESNRREAGGEISGAVLMRGVQEGLFKQPAGQRYLECITSMANADFAERKEIQRDLALLESNEAFLSRDVFELSTFENSIFHGHNYERYRGLLTRLFSKKKIDRSKFLRALTGGLLMDHKRNQLQGLVRFLDALKLTPGESTGLGQDYASLLASPHSFVALMGLKRLQELVASDAMSFRHCAANLTAAFDNPAKGNASKVLTWIAKQTKSDSALIPICVEVVLAGLAHPETEIQKKAIKLLSSWKTRIHRDHVSVMRQSAGSVSATLRGELLELANQIDGLDEDAEVVESFDEPELQTKSARQPCKVLAPIANHEELIDRISAALEETESGIEAELILDAIGRLGPVPEALEARAEPVRQRAFEAWGWSLTAGNRGLADAPDAKPRMWRVVAIALGMTELVYPEHDFDEDEAADFGATYPPAVVPVPLPDYKADGEYSEDSPGYAVRSIGYAWHSRVLWQRLEPLEARLLNRVCVPLLASPTHEHGWIEPRVLVHRLHEWKAKKLVVDDCDLILALMRLAIPGRDVALDALKGLPSELRGVLSVALDGAIPKSKLPLKGGALLQVAARVRQATLSEADAKRLGVDTEYACGSIPKLNWRMNQKVAKANDRHAKLVIGDWNVPSWIQDHPVLSEIHRYKHVHLHPSSAWRLEMDAWNDPRFGEAYFAGALRRLVERVENGASNSAPYHAYFEALFEKDFHWSVTACGVAVVALLGKDNDVITVCIDAMNQAIVAGCVKSDVMAEAMVRVFLAPWPRAARFADSLSRVAESGADQQRFVAECLASLIQAWCEPTDFKRVQYKRLEKPVDCLKILELYQECVAALQLEVPVTLRGSIAKVKAKGKVKAVLTAIA